MSNVEDRPHTFVEKVGRELRFVRDGHSQSGFVAYLEGLHAAKVITEHQALTIAGRAAGMTSEGIDAVYREIRSENVVGRAAETEAAKVAQAPSPNPPTKARRKSHKTAKPVRRGR